MLVIADLLRRIDTQGGGERFYRTVRALSLDEYRTEHNH